MNESWYRVISNFRIRNGAWDEHEHLTSTEGNKDNDPEQTNFDQKEKIITQQIMARAKDQ